MSVTGRRTFRIHLRAALFGVVRREFESRAYEAMGYGVERSETDVSL